ncbi:hypothetical protein EIN_425100 [Entamoeba invadens IP1]|uniref:Small nuclear ribonucleoprotein E n=1 Tax=Entamoeba invadens IP1 TaxID=370355 RepID=A0A0A1U5X7_ENTIV|nr:hypothetical protein EIN_425100 [Entamoeba invadens IP1]ELP89788.1 hypothetical protein EIN_425100 [Entamoeba invadens IP1]|eukprot:XP_004256559.1 hypothetical protein EIN_425100 [Entamoeba invadens IP1]
MDNRAKRAMLAPVRYYADLIRNKQKVTIWLYENTAMKIEGRITAFDTYMNITLEQAEEVYVKTSNRRSIGNIMLKGDNIAVVQKI